MNMFIEVSGINDLHGECLRLTISLRVQSKASMFLIILRHCSEVRGALFLCGFPSALMSLPYPRSMLGSGPVRL